MGIGWHVVELLVCRNVPGQHGTPNGVVSAVCGFVKLVVCTIVTPEVGIPQLLTVLLELSVLLELDPPLAPVTPAVGVQESVLKRRKTGWLGAGLGIFEQETLDVLFNVSPKRHSTVPLLSVFVIESGAG